MAKKTSIKASAFDIRNVIGGLIGLYGVILLIASFAVNPGTDPSNGMPKDATYNIWAGAFLVIGALIFFTWARFNPIIVDDQVLPENSHE